MSKNSVCFINLKGGVGKSTLSVAFAEYLAFVKGQKVLLIDGDPQCNSTAMMVGPEIAQNVDRNHKTLFDLIKTILQGGRQIAIERYIIQNVSNIADENNQRLDLIPSTIRFADWENMLLREMSATYRDTNQLHRTIGRVIDKLEEYSSVTYDWIVVDAPPSFGNQARLVMRLTRFAVLPTTPDPLACHGTSFAIESLRRHSLKTAAACVVISRFRASSDTANKFKSAMLNGSNPPVENKWPRVLKTVIPEAPTLQKISDFHAFETPPKSFDQKYGDEAKSITDMSKEILKIIISYQVASGLNEPSPGRPAPEPERSKPSEKVSLAKFWYLRAADDLEAARIESKNAAADRAVAEQERAESERLRAEARRDRTEAEQSGLAAEEKLALASEDIAKASLDRIEAEYVLAEAEEIRAEADDHRAVAKREREESEKAREEAQRKLYQAEKKRDEAAEWHGDAQREREEVEKLLEAARWHLEEAKERNHRDDRPPRQPPHRPGRPRGPIERGNETETNLDKPKRPKPEIVCWKDERHWLVGIEVPDDTKVLAAMQDSEPLARHEGSDSLYRLRRLKGDLVIIFDEDKADKFRKRLYQGYLLFKMVKDRSGIARQVERSSRGDYVALAPEGWKRDEAISGSEVVEPEPVEPEGYRAHFFFCGRSGDSAIGFLNERGEQVRVLSATNRFRFQGQILHGEAHGAAVYLGSPPELYSEKEKGWSNVGVIVVGEEGPGRNKWRTHFEPVEGSKIQTMPKSVIDRQGGWYFVRIYDTKDELVESMDFSFLTGLKEVRVESPGLCPGPNGYDSAEVKFRHDENCSVELREERICEAVDLFAISSTDTHAVIPAKPNCDRTFWIFRQGKIQIEAIILVERVWWALGNETERPTDWGDKVIGVKRGDFSASTEHGIWLRLPYERFCLNIRAGFDESRSVPYRVPVHEKEIFIPMREFCDAEALQNRGSQPRLQLFISYQNSPHSLPLLEVLSAFACQYCDFAAGSEEQALSHLHCHVDEIFPHLDYDELREKFKDLLLPEKIYKCHYCEFYSREGDSRSAITLICQHQEKDCKKAKHSDGPGGPVIKIFGVVTDVSEIRGRVISNLPIVHKCRLCGKEFHGDNPKDREIHHLKEKHMAELFNIS